jgi:hypothetical protein
MIDQTQLEHTQLGDRQQLEISFAGACTFRPVVRRQKRLTRARWWFRQMRSVVNQARDWAPAPEPRPEQTYLGLAAKKRF